MTILGIMEFFSSVNWGTSQYIISGEKGKTQTRIQTGSSGGRSHFLSLFCLFFFHVVFEP